MADGRGRRRTRQGPQEHVQDVPMPVVAAGGPNLTREIKCHTFDPDRDDIEVWHYKFSNSLRLSKIEDEETKRLLFVESLDTKVLGTLINLVHPRTIDECTFEELYQTLLNNFKVRKLKVVERVKFFSAKQGTESIVGFSNVLRRAATDCKFPSDFQQDALITSFIMGLNDSAVRANLLRKDYNDFNEVVNLASMLTTVKEESTSSSGGDLVHATAPWGPCYACGGKHLRKDCQFKDAVCVKCKKKGHLKSVCKARSPKEGRIQQLDGESETVSQVFDVNNIHSLGNRVTGMLFHSD